MVKILSQSGSSLADVYDVQGSIAGIDQLESREVSLVHEMGGTLESERMGCRMFRVSTGDILQTITTEIVFAQVSEHMGKIIGASIWCDTVARVANASLLLIDDTVGGTLQELPIFAWDSVTGGSTRTQIEDAGTVATFDLLNPHATGMLPNTIVTGAGQPRTVSRVAFRSLSTTFGAGTVEIIACFLVATPSFFAGINSRGLPIPSW